MEESLAFVENVKFLAAKEATGSFRIHISTSDDDFKAAQGEDALADFKLDKVHRVTKDGVKIVTLRQGKQLETKDLPDLSARIVSESQRVKLGEFTLVLADSVDASIVAKLAHCVNVANYRFVMKKEADLKSFVSTVTLAHAKAEEIVASEEFQFEYQVSVHKNLTKDYHNRRGDVATVQFFVDKAKEFKASVGDKIDLKIFHGEKELMDEKLGLIQAVGKGSHQPAALINLVYKGDSSSEEYTALIGKGVVFDQGGANCKTSLIELMWVDKGGACACLAAFQGIVALGLKVNVVCSIAMAENVVSGTSYRPSDIITSHKGLTVEILNTDAEGRLVMCDAISWAQANYKVHTLIDVATLTGATIIALGKDIAAIYSTDDDLATNIAQAGKNSYEQFWRMPFCEVINESMKGKHSDLKNIAGSPWGGAIQAACYLRAFIDDGVKFAHLDIASSADTPAQKNMHAPGSTGFACGALINYFKNIAQ